MTSARRTNLYRIKAVDDVANPVLSVGLTDLAGSVSETYAEVRDDFRLLGNGTFKPSFGEGISGMVPFVILGTYSLYFCMDARSRATQIKDHVFIDHNEHLVFANAIELRDMKDGASKKPAVLLRLSAMAAEDEIYIRMGMSFISSQQACANAEEEIPDFNLETVAASSVAQFEDILNRIRVNITSVDDDTIKLFYSSVHPP